MSLERGRGRKEAKNAKGGATLGYEAQLWQMADALRGSMDAAEYKHVLGLIFLKYISDAFEEHRRHLEQEPYADPGEIRNLAPDIGRPKGLTEAMGV